MTKQTKPLACVTCLLPGVNDFAANVEPKDDMPVLMKKSGQHGYVDHKLFMQMLDCAWFQKEANDSNIMAVLKRTHLFVNTAKFLYVRPAGIDTKPVMRIPLNDKTDLLHEESRQIYDFFRKGGSDMPSDFAEKVEWEAKWMSIAMAGRGKDVPKRAIIRGKSPFANDPPHPRTLRENSPDELDRELAAAPSTMHLSRKRTFEALRATQDIIEIGDSPVRASVPVKPSAKPLLHVKEEVEDHQTTEPGLHEEENEASTSIPEGKALNPLDDPEGELMEEDNLDLELEKLMDADETD